MRVSGLFKNPVTETTTHGNLHQRACFHYHREEGQDQLVTWKRLQENVYENEQGELTRLTNKPPSITSLVYLHPGRRDVRCIAEEGKPHIFDMQIVERFIKRAIELMPLTENKKLGESSSETKCQHTVV